LGGEPQNGRASSVISRFILAATAKRLLVLSALSTRLEARKAHIPFQLGSFSFNASAVPAGKPSGKSKPSRARSPRRRKSARMSRSFSSAALRVCRLKASNARRKRMSRRMTPIQTESLPTLGAEAALQSTIT
jgi:hypothetical protein